jgi:UDP-N-acetylglucosamine--N-acetylmuramyl-(pentapeptide) pyrophosphoryl-undecaprenol N-acetylglucosamine transferase
MKLLVTAGGTGGHVYPALTVLKTLLEQQASTANRPPLAAKDVLWVGSPRGFEQELVDQTQLRYVELAAAGVRGMGVSEKVRHTYQIAQSVGKARSIVGQFKPDVVFATGGYASVAVTVAAWLQHVPVLIYLPDIVPGLAIRSLSRVATRVAVTSEESYQHLKREKVVVTGYPVRPEIFEKDKAEARRELGLEVEENTLLVFGGSRGARSINRAVIAGLRELLPVLQIVHITGRLDSAWVAGAVKNLPESLRARYHHYEFLNEMSRPLKAADLAVARAGAATLGEFPAAGLPAILVPYPYSGQHQLPNAQYMARHGAVIIIPDDQLGKELVPTVLRLVGDKDELATMQEATSAMARPEAAEAIAEQLWLLSCQQGTGSTGPKP